MSDSKFKTRVKAQGGLNLPNESTQKVPVINSSGDVVSSTVTDVELGRLSGVTSSIQTQLNDKISSSEKGVANGVATLGANGKLPSSQLTLEAFEYKGNYNASTNSPTLADGTGNTGDVYHVQVAGSVDFGAGAISLSIGDKVVYNGTIYEKWSLTDSVSSVFGRTGAITAQSGDYSANQITNTAAGSLSSTTVQDAINELDSEKQPIDGTLTALAAFNSNGLVTQTAADTFTSRSIQGTSGNISVLNGSGVAGNPTIDLGDVGTLGTYGADDSTLEIVTDAKGRVTSVIVNAISILASQVSNFASAVRSTVLTGFSTATATPVVDTDTVLQGLGKLQGQINALDSNPNDISLNTFAGANNQTSAANVTGFLFNPSNVRGFKALVSVTVDATTPLYESFEILGVNKGSSFDYAISSTGDDTLITFTVDSSGQVQYTSPSYVGFSSMEIAFRAIVTTV
jgi:hypothetical protein